MFRVTVPLLAAEITIQRAATPLYRLLERHFAPTPINSVVITERKFPKRVRADLQRALDRFLAGDIVVSHFSGVRTEYGQEDLAFVDLLLREEDDPALATPPQYEQVDIGEDEAVPCLKNGLWLLVSNGTKFAVLVDQCSEYRNTSTRFQVAAANDAQGQKVVRDFFERVEEAVQRAESYRGKILSLENHERYSGKVTGIKVHKLKRVDRDQVILPAKTLDLLEPQRHPVHSHALKAAGSLA